MTWIGEWVHCLHHPNYNPDGGEEPTGDSEPMLPIRPCGHCWKARAKWLDKWRGQGAIDDLEKQLAYFTDPHSKYDSSRGCPACEWKDGVITKMCWTHEQNKALQKTGTKLVLEKRELEKQLDASISQSHYKQQMKIANRDLQRLDKQVESQHRRIKELEDALESEKPITKTAIVDLPKLLDRVKEVEQDGKRLDCLQDALRKSGFDDLVLYFMDAEFTFDDDNGLWSAPTLRQAIDKAMIKGE